MEEFSCFVRIWVICSVTPSFLFAISYGIPSRSKGIPLVCYGFLVLLSIANGA